MISLVQNLKKDRIQYWLSVGVQPSPTIYNMLVGEGILATKKIAVHKKSKKAVTAPAAEAPKPAETPKPTETPKAAEAPAGPVA